MPGTKATPPVNRIGSVSFRPVMAAIRVATAVCTPVTMSSGRTPVANSPTISLSAKTTHMLLMTAGAAAGDERFQLVKRSAELGGQHLQKTPRAGRTTVVHDEVGHRAAAVQAHELAVLTADVDDRPGIRHAMADAAGLAGDFRDGGVGRAHEFSTVSGRNHGANVVAPQPLLVQELLQEIQRKTVLIDALIDHARGHRFGGVGRPSPNVGGVGRPSPNPIGVDQHDLERSRSRINSCTNHGRRLAFTVSTKASSRVRRAGSKASLMGGTSNSNTGTLHCRPTMSAIKRPSKAQ